MKNADQIRKEIKKTMSKSIKLHNEISRKVNKNILEEDTDINNICMKLMVLISEIALCRRLLTFIVKDEK